MLPVGRALGGTAGRIAKGRRSGCFNLSKKKAAITAASPVREEDETPIGVYMETIAGESGGFVADARS